MTCPINKTESGEYKQNHIFVWAGSGEMSDDHRCECGAITYKESKNTQLNKVELGGDRE
jgi:hypothetical protein